jgi:hypothetical protein
MEFIKEQRKRTGDVLRPAALAEMVREQFDLSIHPRSIERALSKRQKKGR